MGVNHGAYGGRDPRQRARIDDRAVAEIGIDQHTEPLESALMLVSSLAGCILDVNRFADSLHVP